MINNYLNLITSQHRNQTKYITWLSKFLQIVDDVNTLANEMNSLFDPDNAEGIQLDIIGECVGRKRLLDFQPVNGDPVLDDDTYRLVLKAKIAQNQWDGTIQGINNIWNSIFPNIKLILTDNQNMTVGVAIIGLASDFHKELIQHGYIAPKPQGVSINYSFANNKSFGYDLSNESFAGYDQGYWLNN